MHLDALGGELPGEPADGRGVGPVNRTERTVAVAVAVADADPDAEPAADVPGRTESSHSTRCSSGLTGGLARYRLRWKG
ncbi:hypothetical protein SMICM304S_01895 [Streptomyces microflavus]